MTTSRDADADDLFMDRCLDEQIGGRRPPDLCDRLLAADAATRARAAAAVDAAADVAEAPARVLPFWLGLVAGLLVALLAIGAWLFVGDPVASPQEPAARATALLDEFHRVMPREPVSLRDARRRQRLAASALPVLRELAAYLHDHATEIAYANRADEFVVYALVLGDASMRHALLDRTAAGDADAKVLLLAADVITAGNDHERDIAIAGLGELLSSAAASASVSSAIQCLVTAADLSESEATQLAEQAHDADAERPLRFAAAMAATSPRRLLGKPLELAGRLVDGADFTTASLRGKVVLVCFWATWCQPCLTALPDVLAAQARYADRGLAVVGISCDHDRSALTGYLAEHADMAFPQLFDQGQPGWHELAFFCGVRSIPSLFLIDRRGVLREVNARDDLDALVQRLFAQ